MKDLDAVEEAIRLGAKMYEGDCSDHYVKFPFAKSLSLERISLYLYFFALCK
jgi:hypothetical protein